jgi:hypothetical protein
MKKLLHLYPFREFRQPPLLKLDQPHPLQARMPASADDDVVVHGNAEGRGDIDDRFRHLDIGLRRRGIAGGMVVHQSTTPRISLNFPTYILFPRLTGVSVRDRFLMLDCDRPWRARRGAVSNRRAHQVTDSEATSILIASVVAMTWARYVRFV